MTNPIQATITIPALTPGINSSAVRGTKDRSRLCSLIDLMHELELGKFVNSIRIIQLIGYPGQTRDLVERIMLILGASPDQVGAAMGGPAAMHKDVADVANGLLRYLREIGLDTSATLLTTLIRSLDDGTDAGRLAHVTSFTDGLIAEMGTKLYYSIESQNSRLAKGDVEEEFGTQVVQRYPDLIGDLSEAMKCLAFERGTACVFHLMRCMESACRAVAWSLDPSKPKRNGWGDYYRLAEDTLQGKTGTLPVHYATSKPFYEEVLADLRALYKAWRNPTMHIEKVYTTERAGDILNATKALLRQISDHIEEDGTYIP